MAEKYLRHSSIFTNVRRCNDFLKFSLYFKNISNSLRKVLQTYLEICSFSVIQYIPFQKQSTGGALKVLGKSLQTVLNELHFIVNLYSFYLPPVPQANPFFPQLSHLPPFQVEQLPKVDPSSRHISNCLRVYISLESEP